MTDLQSVLLDLARSFDEHAKPAARWDQPHEGEPRPGDIYNQRASWPDILEPAGWTRVEEMAGDVSYWKRPGNTDHRWSASVGYLRRSDGVALLYVFSSAADPFELEKTYTPFAAYTVLHHGGDYKAAAAELARQGYTARPAPAVNGNGHAKARQIEVAETEEELPWDPPIPLNLIPPPASFPVEVFPAQLQQFVREASWAKSCPPDFVAVPMLGIASGAIGNTCCIAITKDHVQAACLFLISVGIPGSGKSPALELVLKPVEQAEQLARKLWQNELAEWKRNPSEDKGKAPTLRRSLVDDITTERMICLLQENPRGFAMVRDELSALVAGMDQYKNGKGHDRQIYLKLWSSASIRVDRKNHLDGLPVIVYHPFVSIVGGLQPAVLEQLRGSSNGNGKRADDGFIDRFLFTYPENVPAVPETWREVSPEASSQWEAAVYRLLAMEMIPGENGPRPFLHFLSASGRDAWVQFTTEHAGELNDESFPQFLCGPWSKLKGYCPRLALVIHHLRQACGEQVGHEIDGESLGRGAKLVGYFKEHARRVYACMDADAESAQAKVVLRWIHRNQRAQFKAWEAHHDLKSQARFQNAESLDAVLAKLCKHGFLRLKDQESRQGPGRRPAPVYECHPSILAAENVVNAVNTHEESN